MVKIRKIVIVGLVMLSTLTSFGFCAGDYYPDPPHSIIYAKAK